MANAKLASAKAIDRAEQVIRAKPLTTLCVAAGLGMLVAFWSKRK